MNKKGIVFLSRKIINLIISVIVIIALVYLGFRLYSTFTEQNEKQRLLDQMEKIIEVVEKVDKEGIVGNVDLFPITGWSLRSFENNVFPNNYCTSGRDVDCLCMCHNLDCSGNDVICEGLEFEVRVDEVYRSINDYQNTLYFNKASDHLVIIKEGDIIVIRR